MATLPQRWARQRNWDKARLRGCLAALRNLETLTRRESYHVREALVALAEVDSLWSYGNDYSKSNFMEANK